MLHKMIAIVSRNLRQQGRFLRRQVFDLALTLMIIGGGMLLFLAALIAGGMTAYETLHPVTGPAGALAIITAFLLIASIVMGIIGYHIQSQSDELAKEYSRQRAVHDRPYDAYDNDDADDYDTRTAFENRPPSRPMRGGPSAQRYAHTPPAPDAGIDELELAREYIAMTHDQIDKKLDIVRRHPVTSVGVAMGLGLLLGRSKGVRFVAKSAVLMGGKLLMDRYLSDKKH